MAMKKGSSMNEHLSEDIIGKIMLLLSMKILLRCKSVCKLWYKIIADPNLAYMHSKKKSTIDSFLLQHSPETGFLPLKELAKSTDDDDESIYLRSPKQPRRWVPSHAVVGSCNGLVCLRDNGKRKYQIMNPLYSVTDTYQLEIPSPDRSTRSFTMPVGFGFDEVSHKFKIVCIRNGEPSKHERSVRLSVHELGNPATSSWRELSQSIGSWYVFFLFGKSGVFVDGSIHWQVNVSKRCQQKIWYRSIVSFNLTTEELVIKHLGLESLYARSYCRLLDLNGTLGVLLSGSVNYAKPEYCFRFLGLCGDADNMMEDNNEETTTKLVDKFCIKLSWSWPSIEIAGILKARHILILNKKNNGPHFSYDMQTGITTEVPDLSDISNFLSHQGSLIRPSDLASLCNSV